MTYENPTSISTTITGIAAILQAIAWPTAIAMLLLIYKARIWSLLEVITKKIETATKVKAWELEIETTEQEIKQVVKQAGEAGAAGITERQIPKSQVQAAKAINKKLQETPLSERRVVSVVADQVGSLIQEYERIRNEWGPGPSRTRKMNEVAAKMRALSLAARPMLPSLTLGASAGEKLAAICFLQVEPDAEYFPWLIEQVMNAQQAFILFQASVAVLELVRNHKYADGAGIKQEIERALQHVSNFAGGRPDQNTMDVLNDALKLLR